MAIVVTCAACKVRLTLRDDSAGDMIECPKCDSAIRVPRIQPSPVPAPLSLPEPEDTESYPLSLDEPKPYRKPILYTGVVIAVLTCISLGVWLIGGKKSAKEQPTAAASEALTGEQIYRRLIRSSVLIVSKHGEGSGFVVHTEKRFVVTNYHVVDRESRVVVVFPLYDDKGELITDTRRYESRIKDLAIRGEVIDRDAGHDLALIRVERLPQLTGAVSLAPRPAATGSVVYSVGGSGADENLLWRLTKGNVRGRVERQQQVNFGASDCMILETDAPVNPGDSGGPVVSDRGELVAVVAHFLTNQRSVSGNIDVEEVRRFLSRHLSP